MIDVSEVRKLFGAVVARRNPDWVVHDSVAGVAVFGYVNDCGWGVFTLGPDYATFNGTLRFLEEFDCAYECEQFDAPDGITLITERAWISGHKFVHARSYMKVGEDG